MDKKVFTMLNKIIKFSLDNRLVVIMAAALLLMCGIYTAKNMEVDVFPDLNAPTVTIMTEAPGLAPEEVEQLVSFPIETAVNGATGVRRVRSSSTTGFSIVWVEFDWDTDIYLARQIVSEKLSTLSGKLPNSAGTPQLGPQTSILGEVMIIGLSSDSVSLLDLRTTADFLIRPRLLSVTGVAQVHVIGGDVKEYQILLDPLKMRHYGVTLDDVMRDVKDLNENAAGGIIYQYGNEYIIRGAISSKSADDMAECLIKRAEGEHIHLYDIAEVKIGSKAPKIGLASSKAKPAVLITVTKQPEAGTMVLTENIDKVMEDIKSQMPRNIDVDSNIFRQSRFIDSSISNIQKSLYEGGIFVVIILFIFLMSVRTTIISVVTIPLSLIVSILTLKLMGLTINTMSIGGMAIAIGSLVDDAIVDVENVYKRLRQNNAKEEGKRLSTLQVVFEASKEVRLPILNSTLIIVVSFLPLFFLSGMEGKMLAPLGISFIVALFASTIIALTLTPVMCSYLLGGKRNAKEEREPIVSRVLGKWYKQGLKWSLNHKKAILIPTIAITISAIAAFFTLGRSFLPQFNEGSLTINISSVPGISLEESDKIGRLAEEILLTVPEIKTVARKTGRAELAEHSFGVNASEIEAPFELNDRSKKEMLKEVREKLSVLPGVNIEIGQPISHRIDAMLSGTRANIAIKIFGKDLNQMYNLGSDIQELIKDVEGIADVNVEQQIERPQLRITPNRELLSDYGITLGEFGEMIHILLAGEVVSQVYDGNSTFDVTVKLNDNKRTSLNDVRSMLIDSSEGKIPLHYVAKVESVMGPNTINRESAERKIVVSANMAGGDLLGGVNEIKKRINENITLPEGYHIEYGGQFESEAEASKRLSIMSVFSIIVIFLLLYNQFKSSVQAGVILLNLPLALIGGVFVLLFSDGIISIPAIIGFISLFGIATRNGMLLISRYNTLRDEGKTIMDTIIEGSTDRLNPIIMTALTSMLALIPLAIGGELPGNEIQSPMAKVILGGLFTSTLLNMFVIPIVYMIIENKKRRI